MSYLLHIVIVVLLLCTPALDFSSGAEDLHRGRRGRSDSTNSAAPSPPRIPLPVWIWIFCLSHLKMSVLLVDRSARGEVDFSVHVD